MQKGIWLKKNRIKNIYPYLSSDIECDVVIVGGGICGAITAYFLAKDGFSVALIEKNLIGYSTTGISSACITDFTDELYTRAYLNTKEKNIQRKLSDIKRRANALLDEIIVDIGKNEYLKRTEYTILNTKMFQRGLLKLEMNLRNKLGEKAEIDSSNTLSIKQGARMLDAYDFTSKILEYISNFPNVHIFENTMLKEVHNAYDYVEIVTQNDFKIKAYSLILTTSIDYIPISNMPNIEMCKRFSTMLKTNLKKRMCIKVLNDIPLYIRCDESGNMIISGVDTRFTYKMENDKYMKMLEKENERKLKNVILKMFPKIEIADEITSFSGNIYRTKDNMPLISEIDNLPNIYVNIGMGSASIAQMLIGADILKEAIKGYYKKDMNLFKINR